MFSFTVGLAVAAGVTQPSSALPAAPQIVGSSGGGPGGGCDGGVKSPPPSVVAGRLNPSSDVGGSEGGTSGCPPTAPRPASPYRELADWERELWDAGRALFEKRWTADQGLGAPRFNAQSCATCHVDPVLGGAGGPQFDVPASAYDPRRGHPRRRGPVSPARTTGTHQTPTLLGLGRIETIADAAILAHEDPYDRDGDGVRGVASRVVVDGRSEIGRFGWRAQAPTLADFTCDALGAEIGVTVADLGRSFGVTGDRDGTSDPELPNGELQELVFFCRMLAPPAPLVPADELAHGRGRMLFTEVGCAACHVPALAGQAGPVPLYSDLLLHAVARPLDEDGAPDGEPAAFRTPPLWGVRDTPPYLHDGRAQTLEAAIRAHDGEAARTTERFVALEDADRAALLAFLGTL